MKAKITLLLLLILLATGCASSPGDQPSDNVPSPQSPAPQKPAPQDPAPQNPAPAPGPEQSGVPRQDEVCRKPEGGPEISFRMARAQSDGAYDAKAGWTVPWHNTQVLGWIHFPRAIVRESVKISVESPDWVYVPSVWSANDDKSVPFFIMPKDGSESNPLQFRTGETGWVTLKVESATDADGEEVLTAPAILTLFMFDNEMMTKNDYLGQCLASIGVTPGS